MTHTISIDPDKCKKEGLCARVCPALVYICEKGSVPRLSNMELCNRCGQCLAICPCDAISHSGLDRAQFLPIQNHHPVEPDALAQLIRQRRSVRAYKNQPVARELLEKVVQQAAAFGPTGSHGGEAWKRRLVIVTGEDKLRRVRELTVAYWKKLGPYMDGFMVRTLSRWKEAPRAGRLMLPDMKMRLAAYEQGHDIITYNAPALLFVHCPRVTPTPQVDSDLILYPIILLAEAYGLGTCWNGYLAKAASGFRIDFSDLRTLLRIPEHHDCFAAATIGYPAVRLHSVPQREVDIEWVD